jgi:hypothetical protein
MKTFLTVLILAISVNTFSQSLVLDVSYYKSENDKNRSTRTEKISVTGSESSYSIDYTGRSMPNEINEVKNCNLSQAAMDEVFKSIESNKISRDVSFYAKERTNGEGTFYLIISVKMTYNGVTTEILLDGEANLIMENKAYRDVIDFIKDLRKIIRDC